MTALISIRVNDKLYLRDPEESALGRKIISYSIKLVDQIGYEDFTFKKLAAAINSTEASIYRYFKSKNKLLNYLRSWHWGWLQYKIAMKTENIADPKHKLEIALKVLVESGKDDPLTPHIDEAALHRIIVAESAKAYLVKEVRAQAKEGMYEGLESFSAFLAKMVKEYNPRYAHPRTMIISVIVIAHRLMFYLEHGLRFTEIHGRKNDNSQILEFLNEMLFRVVAPK